MQSSPSPDTWVLPMMDGEPKLPQTLHASAGQTWEEGQACSGTWVFRGPCRADLLPHHHHPPLPLWTRWPCLRPRPHRLEGQPHSAAFVLGKLSLLGGG